MLLLFPPPMPLFSIGKYGHQVLEQMYGTIFSFYFDFLIDHFKINLYC